MTTDDIDHLTPHVREAVRLSREHVARGGIPFSGIVVRDGQVLGTGFNRVREDRDATAHAEVVALRDAARKAGLSGVAGTTLIASGEPCAMCYLVALHFNVEHIVFAADRRTAGAHGFDYAGSYSLFATDPTAWPIRVTHAPVEGHEEPFREFLSRRGSVIR
ncbi:nucleoside deaminase [Streptomyces thermolineatus]|uniref:Nucleoside deaminase n=1 Tax=Streptomyces thermolineatus TaxID=44033 RepID=A0ABP5Z4R1_9ACTN